MEKELRSGHRVMKNDANIIIHVEPRISHIFVTSVINILEKKNLRTRLCGHLVVMRRININSVGIMTLSSYTEKLRNQNFPTL
jgi:hypothetical protein